MTRAELLAQALDEFLDVSPDVEASAVVSSDGLPMASALPPGVQEDKLAAMSAALLILGERAASGLGKGDLAQVLVEGSDGYVVLMAAGPHAVLVAVASTQAKAGLLLFEMRRMAGRVSSLMQQDMVAGGSDGSASFGAAGGDSSGQPVPGSASPAPESSVSTWQ